MHGRRRKDYKALHSDPKVVAKLASKAVAWNQLQKELLARLKQGKRQEDTGTTLQLVEKALTVNPDPLWLWNFRRSLVDNDPEWETEARVTQAALESNPKSYGAWHHRKWCLRFVETKTVKAELPLTAAFLLRDERNFHCWSYRRFVVSRLLHGPSASGTWKIDGILWMGPQLGGPKGDTSIGVSKEDALPILQAEWQFTDEKIRDNFSNFSAFHYRSQLFKLLKPEIQPEFELVANAVCTEPDDQTAWWYQSFLLNAIPDVELSNFLATHIELLKELKEETQSKSKWVLLGIFQCLEHQNDTQDERNDLLSTLQVLDPDRSQRYREMIETPNVHKPKTPCELSGV